MGISHCGTTGRQGDILRSTVEQTLQLYPAKIIIKKCSEGQGKDKGER